MVPYLWLGAGFSCCKIWHSMVAVTRSALVSGSLCLFMCSLGNDRDDRLTRLSVHSLGHPIYSIIDLLRWGDLLMSIYMGHENLLFFTHSVRPIHALLLRPIHALLPQMSWSPSSNHVLSKFLTIQPIHWLQPMDRWTITDWAISPPKQNVWPGALPKVLLTVKISLR